MSELTARVFETIDGMQDEIVEKISEVVRVPSINPKYPGVVAEEVLGGETNANQVVSDLYRTVGCEVDVWEEEARRANAVGVLKGAGGGKSLIFNGHIDTVPTGRPEDWRWSDPFSGNVDGGKIYGRGSCDMKGPVVSQAMAALALQRLGIRLKGDLILESVVGEEVMDHEAGVTATVRRGYRADAAVVSEASAPVRPLAIVPISPGLLWMAVTCRGKSSHASTRAETFRAGGFGASVAVNAIDKGMFIFECLRKLEDEWGLTKNHDLFKPGHFTLPSRSGHRGASRRGSPLLHLRVLHHRVRHLVPPGAVGGRGQAGGGETRSTTPPSWTNGSGRIPLKWSGNCTGLPSRWTVSIPSARPWPRPMRRPPGARPSRVPPPCRAFTPSATRRS